MVALKVPTIDIERGKTRQVGETELDLDHIAIIRKTPGRPGIQIDEHDLERVLGIAHVLPVIERVISHATRSPDLRTVDKVALGEGLVYCTVYVIILGWQAPIIHGRTRGRPVIPARSDMNTEVVRDCPVHRKHQDPVRHSSLSAGKSKPEGSGLVSRIGDDIIGAIRNRRGVQSPRHVVEIRIGYIVIRSIADPVRDIIFHPFVICYIEIDIILGRDETRCHECDEAGS